jgi:hypothetical protein
MNWLSGKKVIITTNEGESIIGNVEMVGSHCLHIYTSYHKSTMIEFEDIKKIEMMD